MSMEEDPSTMTAFFTSLRNWPHPLRVSSSTIQKTTHGTQRSFALLTSWKGVLLHEATNGVRPNCTEGSCIALPKP